MRVSTPEAALETIVLQWNGPYTLTELQRLEAGNGIYLLTGTKKYSRTQLVSSDLLYCGITEKKFRDRINQDHEQIARIRAAHLRIWLGQPLFPAQHDRSHLELAETCLISFWQPELNTKKRAYYPRKPVCLVVKWCKQDGTAYKRFPQDVARLKDVLWWDCQEWRTGDLRVAKP